MTVWKNDISGSMMLDPQMVKFIDPVSGLRVFFVQIPNEGLFAVNYFTGEVTFTPDAGFVGVSTINYDIQDLNGEFSNPAAITVTVTDTPLPVKLTFFEVIKEGNTARLNWESIAETNSDHFEIEHSISGKEWNRIGLVTSQGESAAKIKYSFTDKNPANEENLYRLKMIDKDATFAYSRIQSIKFDGQTGPMVSIYPNPSADRVFIQDMAQVKQVSIMDMNGRAVFSSNTVTSNGINVSKFTPGTYILHVTNMNGTVSNHKIVIAK
ncbi:T9SS type A sorting domain-containing protein [Dyadobacter sp. 3J3]|uniref:T9SS type A sorting domain-containing protein n=1 Tax=Dyadobacter sp. 3J3 TaxID=2606600 RepID=UPI001357CCDB|nr:T9SS type A sorting domain-containing protein [Dyadobacter sp. 3J3]